MPNFNCRVLQDDIKADGLAPIKIRITHLGSIRRISTSYSIDPKYFDNKKGRAKPEYPLCDDLNIELTALELTYQRKAIKLESRIHDISMDELIAFLKESDKLGNIEFFSLAKKKIQQMEKAGKYNSVKLFKLLLKKVKEYNGTDQLPFSAITPSWLKGFEAWMLMSGSQNSVAIHLRNIRTLCNTAINEYNLSPEYYPFRRFKIKTKQTLHRDLTIDEVGILYWYEPTKPNERKTLDLWMLSFFLCGVNFKDLLTAPASSLKKGRFTYNRAKTGTIYTVKVEAEAQTIIDRHKGLKYLLNFIEEKQKVVEKVGRTTPLYKDVLDDTNGILKTIAKNINKDVERIETDLSTYYARHSWGSIASKLDVSHDVIREALGHSRSVTDVYINFYAPKIDEANRKVIDAIKKEASK